MKKLLALILALACNGALAQPLNVQPFTPLVSSGPCLGSNQCPGNPNDSTHGWYVHLMDAPLATQATANSILLGIGTPADAAYSGSGSGSVVAVLKAILARSGVGATVTIAGSLPAFGATPTFNLGTLNGAALDTSLQGLLSKLNAGINVNNLPTTQAISAAVLPLPNGAATSALQPALDTGDFGAKVHVQNFPTTQPISAASLPNPTGAPTATAQALQLTAEQATASALAGPITTVDKNGAAFSSATVMTPGGSAVAVGRSVEMLISAAGNVSLQLGGVAHIISVSASPYTQTFPYAVTGINSSGTTATGTYANLY